MTFLEEFSQRIGLPADAASTLAKTHAAVKDAESFQALSAMITKRESFEKIAETIKTDAETLKLDWHTYAMAVLCGNVPVIRERYAEKGAGDDIFWDSMIDFRCKINECKKVYGVWGIDPITWYAGFFEAKIFKLGRLEYEVRDEGVYSVHIPSCGALHHEDVLDSYKRAYVFFGGKDGAILPFLCSSYLLFPAYQKAVFPENGNIHRFAEDFTIIRIDDKQNFRDAWRVFDRPYTGDLTVLPQNTSLQRAFVAYMKENDNFGTGLGLFLFDGETIRTDKPELLAHYASYYLS